MLGEMKIALNFKTIGGRVKERQGRKTGIVGPVWVLCFIVHEDKEMMEVGVP
jgi:hypothetical protein